MTAKKWWVVIALCTVFCIVFLSAEFRKERAFQEEKEATRKAEFTKLLRIHEEEKEADEKRRREDRQQQLFDQRLAIERESADRQTAIMLSMMQALTSTNQNLTPDVGHIPSIPELMSEHTNSGDTIVEARITNDFDGLKYSNIYKLDNGQVWEQTDFYIYIYISVTPKVTIWWDGFVHKMKVEGIDKVVTVQQLKGDK